MLSAMSKLTAKQEAFAVALCDPSKPSLIDAYRTAGYSVSDPPTSGQTSAASVLAADPRIIARVQEARSRVLDLAMIDAAFVLREWVTIATADPAELIRSRKFCCRHCYGIDHKYQWINEEEFALACANVIDYNATKPAKSHARAMPDPAGGFGYQRSREPVATCTHCSGDGYVDTYIEDTHRLSPAGRKLYAGLKQTNNGIEIKFRDQDAALNNIAKYLGMVAERHMHGGDPNNPTPIVQLTGDITEAEAAKLYAAAMGHK